MSKRTKMVATIFFTLTICFCAPLEIYFTNINNLWFTLNQFVGITIAVSTMVFAICLIVSKLCKGSLSNLYVALIFSVAVLFYCQSNFMNLELGVMNGVAINWDDYIVPVTLNLFIWLLVIILCIFLSLKKEQIFDKIVVYLSTCLLLIQLVTVGVLFARMIINNEEKGKGYSAISTDGLYEVGDENVIVFLLDMFDNRYMQSLVKDNPTIIKELQGFTYFANNTGGYSTTNYSLGHLVTGKYFKNEGTMKDWIEDVCKENYYLDELTVDGFKTYIFTDMYSLFPDRIVQNSENYGIEKAKISNKLHFSFDLYQLVACKYFPNIFKAYIWMNGTEFDTWKDSNAYTFSNTTFKKNLEEKGIVHKQGEKHYKFIHLDGTHYPYYIDKNGETVEENSVTDVECAQGVMHIIQEYLDGMKQNGTYDKSAIFIIADHGYYWDGTLENPVFLAKPMNAQGNMITNNAPVCQADFPATILQLARVNKDYSETYGKSAFDIPLDSNRIRMFYQYYLKEKSSIWKYRLIEYKVDPDGNTRDKFHLTDVEYTVNGNKIEHAKYCKTCKGEDVDNEPDIDFPRIVHNKDDSYPNE